MTVGFWASVQVELPNASLRSCMCRPFFLPCLGAALISAVATLSNIVILKETLPRIVEVRAAIHAAKLQDEEQPLLQSNGKASPAELALDSEGDVP